MPAFPKPGHISPPRPALLPRAMAAAPSLLPLLAVPSRLSASDRHPHQAMASAALHPPVAPNYLADRPPDLPCSFLSP